MAPPARGTELRRPGRRLRRLVPFARLLGLEALLAGVRLAQRLVLHEHGLGQGIGGTRRAGHLGLDQALGLGIAARHRRRPDAGE
jgi:hypothetical protein